MLATSTHRATENFISSAMGAFPPALFSGGKLVIRQIEGFHERIATDLLVRRMYAWRGYRVNPHTTPPRESERVTIAAWHENVLAATVTVSIDHGNGLMCESLYPVEIAGLRRKASKLCEYSRLAVDPEYSSQELLQTFFRVGCNFARGHFGASDAVVEINPRHCRYYERALGFTRLGPRRLCPRVDAPAILLYKDLRHSK